MKKLLALSLLFLGLNSSLNAGVYDKNSTPNQDLSILLFKSSMLINDVKESLKEKKIFGVLNIRDGAFNWLINKVTTTILTEKLPSIIPNDANKITQNFIIKELSKRIIKKFSPFKKDDCVSDAIDLAIDGHKLYKNLKNQAPLN